VVDYQHLKNMGVKTLLNNMMKICTNASERSKYV